MALSAYGIVLPPYVAVQLSANVQGFTRLDARYAFGLVDTINYNCNRVQVGQSCMFNKTDSILATVGGIDYYLTEEKNILLQELPPL